MSEVPNGGSWLETVRVARGFTQAQLATAAGLAQGVISKLESGALPMESARTAVLASALDVPVALIDGSVIFPPHSRVFHRKQASLPAKAANRLRADMALAHFRVSRLLGADGKPDVPRLPLVSPLDTPADRAREVRRHWNVEPGPIPDVVRLLEDHGVPCLMWNVESARVDAIASWPSGACPIVMLGSHAPGDRLRFTVAHELGHAVMHELPSAECEREADAFASEFLMPRSDIGGDLQGATLPRLAELKRAWGTSIAALVRRARDVGAITDYAYRDLNIELSASGHRKQEPVTVQREQPTLIERTVAMRQAKGELLASIAADALITVEELKSRYLGVP